MCKPWTCNEPFSFKDEHFSKIYTFFVIETPIEDDSVRNISLKKRMISSNSLMPKLKSFSKELNSNWYPIHQQKYGLYDADIKELFNNNGFEKHTNNYMEFAAFRVPKNATISASFIHCIRCSFAHGGFCTHISHNGDKYYFFENINNTIEPSEINSRIVIKEDTLLKFVEFCNNNLKKEEQWVN